MKLTELILSGAFIIDPKTAKDTTGHTTDIFSSGEYAKNGLESSFSSIQKHHALQKATVRGLTYQIAPKAETRVFWCTKGSVYSVVIDLRADSPTFEVFYGVELIGTGGALMYIPKGFAHGFLTLEDDTETICMSSEPYSKEHQLGIRYNDRKFRIQWPIPPRAMNLQDRRYPDYTPKK